jgi:hypothetical protein
MAWVYRWDAASSSYQTGYISNITSGAFVAVASFPDRASAQNACAYLNGAPHQQCAAFGVNLTGGVGP